MGTNYYLRYNMCKCCSRYDQIHIGKSSWGWSFTFHAPDEWIDMRKLDPKFALAEEGSDYNLQISSYKEWKEFFEKYVTEYETAKIFDEYGTEISLEEFYKMVETKKGGKNHAREMATDPKYSSTHDPKRDFIDKEGNSFSRVEFC